MYNFNPLQARYDMLNRQKQEIDNQMSMLQGQMTQTPINQTFQIASPQPQQNNTQFDFNGKVANGLEEAKKVTCESLPVIIMDSKEPKFYMRNLDGSFKTFRFEECEEPPKQENNNEIQAIKQQLQALENNFAILIQQLTNTANNAQPVENNKPKSEPKKAGGKKNEQSSGE